MKANCNSHTPAALTPGQKLTIPTEQELHGAQSQYERFGETRSSNPGSFSPQTTHYTDYVISTNIHSQRRLRWSSG